MREQSLAQWQRRPEEEHRSDLDRLDRSRDRYRQALGPGREHLGQCQGLVKSGRRCARMALEGGEYCRLHEAQEEFGPNPATDDEAN